MKKERRLARYGQVVCRISGEEPLRFLNLCRSRRIRLYNVRKKDDGYICAMSVSDFFLIRHLRHMAGVHIRVIRRKGIPFLLQRLEKRSAFLLGMACFGALLWICYGFIWDIRISGNLEITDESILRYLKSCQITCGIAKKSVDAHSIAADLRNAFPSFSWVSVEKTGTVLKIQVEEAKKSADVSVPDGDGSLYADREGQVASVITRSGICVIEEGDYVYPGDLLVSGEVPIIDDSGSVVRYEYCEADADIVLETAYVYYDKVEYSYTKRRYEDGRLSMVQVGLNDTQLRIGKRKLQGDMRARLYRFRLSEAFVLPVTLTLYETMPYTQTGTEYSQEEVSVVLQEHFSEFYEQLRKKVMRITENDVKIKLYDNYAVAYGIVYTQESTGALSQTEKNDWETERNDS